MKKKFFAFLLALTMVLPLVPVFELPLLSTPVSAVTSGDYTYTVSDGKATITDVSTAISGEVIIPSTLGNNYPVTVIYLCVQFVDLFKVFIGIFLLRSGIWAENIVNETKK